jgi:prepilin-type N-terminal cleavage/methylation domain-containing protein
MIHNNKGFSLIETVIAIVIIGIITSMLIFLINSSNNAQKRTNAKIRVLNELSNIYNAFSSLKDAESMKAFLVDEYNGDVDDDGNYVVTLYFNSKGYKIVCSITTETSETESTHLYLYTLETKVLFPEETTPRELISPRSIKVGGE